MNENSARVKELIAEHEKALKESRLVVSDLKRKLQEEETTLNHIKIKLAHLVEEVRRIGVSDPDERENNEAAIDKAFLEKLDELMQKV